MKETMAKDRVSLATEIIGEVKKQRNIWRLVAVTSILLNIIQWVF